MLNAADAASAQRCAIHHEGVELHASVAIQEASASGVESIIIFHHDDSFLDGIERRAAALEHAPARSQSVLYPADVCVDHVIGHGPRATVDYQDGIDLQDSPRTLAATR
jgi:hypothetical protein